MADGATEMQAFREIGFPRPVDMECALHRGLILEFNLTSLEQIDQCCKDGIFGEVIA